jgi:DNA-binding NarL/FixJ family response regulator
MPILSYATVAGSLTKGNNLGGVCSTALRGVVVAKVRVLLADDHVAILARVRRGLGENFEIVETAKNGEEAVEAVLRLDPDVLVMDVSMPVLDGFQAASRIRAAGRRTKVIFLTVHEDADFVSAAFSVGASGYVTKSRLSTDLVPAIYDALQGRSFVSPLSR